MRLTWRPLIVLALVAAGAVGPTGCASCRTTALTVEPVPAAALTGPVTIEARLTSGGNLVPGAGIAFLVTGTGPNGWTGQSIGGANTDPDGVARLTVEPGLASQVPLGYQVTGVRAELRATGSPDGEDYCEAEDEVQIPV